MEIKKFKCDNPGCYMESETEDLIRDNWLSIESKKLQILKGSGGTKESIKKELPFYEIQELPEDLHFCSKSCLTGYFRDLAETLTGRIHEAHNKAAADAEKKKEEIKQALQNKAKDQEDTEETIKNEYQEGAE